MDIYKHIQIEREEKDYQYKGHSNPNAPKPPLRDRQKHGAKLGKELEEATEKILNNRRLLGINTDSLMVIEMSAEALPGELLEVLLDRFSAYLVEEIYCDNGSKTKLTIQFENKKSIELFNKERELWKEDSREETVLTYAKRRDLFNSIETVRCINREDRIGKKLRQSMNEGSLDRYFKVNIDIWYNNESRKKFEIERQIKKILSTDENKLLGDLFEIPSLLLGKAKVNEFTLNALLDMDIVSSVELPFNDIETEHYKLYDNNYEPIVQDNLNDEAPAAAVLDSGIFSANPLLKTVIIAEQDFDEEENTTTDKNGHGTAVAGIVAYGDFTKSIESRIFKPLVRVYNGKIMHDKAKTYTEFRSDKRPEELVKEAIEYFYKEYGCRIFNLSVGNLNNIYYGGRQFPCASMLDDLSRKLDIVIIVSIGNNSSVKVPEFTSREELMQNVRDQLFAPDNALIDPATSALSITVGSITRFSEPSTIMPMLSISAGLQDHLSAFTRIGHGINKSIKPEFVDYGGNFAVRQYALHNNNWDITNKGILEPTLSNHTDKIFKGVCGTSFSAPHITHVAARMERSLEKHLERKPSANLIRAMLANSASCSKMMQEWGSESKDIYYQGNKNPKQDRLLRLYGYGKITDNLFFSTDKSVTLIAEDRLFLRDYHLYKIPVPKEFLTIKAAKSIVISLAYNPVTKIERKEYLANNLWIEVFRRIDNETLAKYKAKRESGDNAGSVLDSLPDRYKIKDFHPGSTVLQKSTLQQMRWDKGPMGGSDLLWDESLEEPYIYLMVTGKERFKYAEQNEEQDYAVCVTFKYASKEKIDLYNRIRNNVKIKAVNRVQPRIKIK